MTDRKKTGTSFWTAVAVVAVLLAYPLSFGPACWLTSQNVGLLNSPPPHERVPWAMIIYWPLGRLARSESPLRHPVRWWMTLGLRRGTWAVVMTSPGPDYFICQ